VLEAGRRLAAMPHVEVRFAQLLAQWPDAETFDLVVVSELGHCLDAAALALLCERAARSLRPEGTVVVCHWRHPIAGCPLTGDEVHAAMALHLGLHRLGGVIEADFRIDVWSGDPRSVASREGLV
jgi:SAM-dependent methyltransferase